MVLKQILTTTFNKICYGFGFGLGMAFAFRIIPRETKTTLIHKNN